MSYYRRILGHPTNYCEVAVPATWSPAPARSSPRSSVSRSDVARSGSPGCSKTWAVEPGRGALDDVATGVGQGGQDHAAVVVATEAFDVPLLDEPLDRTGHAGGMHLEQGSEARHRHRAGLHEGQQAQHLVARERQVERSQHGVDALHQQLLDAHDGGHHGHAVGGVVPAVADPLAVRLVDRVPVCVSCGQATGDC